MIYGAATSSSRLRTDTAYRTTIIQECGIITPEYEMKWDRMRPTATTYNFTDADYIVNFARQHGILVHGHTLCWHRALPSWFDTTVNRSNAEQFLRNHIQTVVSRYRGQIYSWDVVNEAIEPRDATPYHLRNSRWYQYLGENYIDIAFRAAAAADPSALLVYNEYDVEFDDNIRRDAILNLLRRLKARRVPIHALGIQGHMRAADRAKLNAHAHLFRQFLNDVAALGLQIIITEFDCDDRSLPASIQQRDAGVAQMYGDYCAVVMNNPAVVGFITWGITDKYTELNSSAPRADREPQRPLPLDATMQRKSAWYALEWWFMNTFARPQRTTAVTNTLPEHMLISELECAPNPAIQQARISFHLNQPRYLHIYIVDVQGRIVARLAHEELFSQGLHRRVWDIDPLSCSQGLYYCCISSSGNTVSIPIVVVR